MGTCAPNAHSSASRRNDRDQATAVRVASDPETSTPSLCRPPVGRGGIDSRRALGRCRLVGRLLGAQASSGAVVCESRPSHRSPWPVCAHWSMTGRGTLGVLAEYQATPGARHTLPQPLGSFQLNVVVLSPALVVAELLAKIVIICRTQRYHRPCSGKCDPRQERAAADRRVRPAGGGPVARMESELVGT